MHAIMGSLVALVLCGMPAAAQEGGFYGKAPKPGLRPGMPQALKEVGFDQRLGETVPLDLEFRDETGRTVRLGDYFGERPVVLSLVYYECPMLCTMVLNGLTASLEVLRFDAGKEFEVVTVSFDPSEGPELAAAKKKTYVEDYGRPGAEAGWHFLTGDAASIAALTQAVGFRYVYDEDTRQYAHASGVMVLTPSGKLARYFYGIEYAPRDLRLGLIEAADERIGSLVDQALLYCYRYDPASGTYSAVVLNILRIAAILTLAGLALMFFLMRKRAPKQQLNSRTA